MVKDLTISTDERAAAIAALRSSVDPWFERHGVPHFNHRYSALQRVPTVLFLLATVVAFEVGVCPFIQPTATQLLLAPGLLVALALWAKPALLKLVGRAPDDLSRWSLPVRAVGLIVAGYLLGTSELPPLWSNPWVDFGVIFGCLATFVVLSDGALWNGAVAELAQRRRRLVLLVIAAIILFALEGSLFAPFSVPLNDAARQVAPALLPVPQALPALLVVAIIFVFTLHLARLSRALPAEPPQRVAERRSEGKIAVIVPAVPLLLLVFSGETAVLPHALDDGWSQAVPPLALLIAFACVAWIASRRSAKMPTIRDSAWIANLLKLSIGAYLFTYPVLVYFFFDVDAFTWNVSGWPAFALTLAINMLYLGIAWFIVSYGLDRVVAWARHGARANLASVVQGLTRGLPPPVLRRVSRLHGRDLGGSGGNADRGVHRARSAARPAHSRRRDYHVAQRAQPAMRVREPDGGP